MLRLSGPTLIRVGAENRLVGDRARTVTHDLGLSANPILLLDHDQRVSRAYEEMGGMLSAVFDCPPAAERAPVGIAPMYGHGDERYADNAADCLEPSIAAACGSNVSGHPKDDSCSGKTKRGAYDVPLIRAVVFDDPEPEK